MEKLTIADRYLKALDDRRRAEGLLKWSQWESRFWSNRLMLWKQMAKDLYAELMVEKCWHCGCERNRQIEVDELASQFRELAGESEDLLKDFDWNL